jgi:UDP-N-acetylglucosamine--N-acetylmuramyl-(pentapeptide) pyrophosphoryl-undecaprenol N-acetylglucosamine transferase
MTGKLLIAGGGTGGHIFPGIAIATEWRNRGGEAVFVGTPRGQEGRLVPEAGFPLQLLPGGALKGRGLLQKLRTLLGLIPAICRATALLRHERPACVLGIGGYASGPMCLAACLLRIPTAITDQNAQPGFTNRVLGRFVRCVFISFEEAGRFFPARKTFLTGNPVRAQIRSAPYRPPQQDINILIFGGSQGAVAINEKFLAAAALLGDLKPRFKIAHNSGKGDHDKIVAFYREHGIVAEVQPFFTDMHARYAAAHLVICRAGAGTLTELALAGRPAILIPYPFAADDHQKKNAEVFVRAGAAWMVEQQDLTAESLAKQLRWLFDNPIELIETAQRVREMARPDAEKRIVEGLEKLTVS